MERLWAPWRDAYVSNIVQLLPLLKWKFECRPDWPHTLFSSAYEAP